MINVHKINVNKKCYAEKEKCFIYLIQKSKVAKNKKIKNKENFGNPASDFCDLSGGKSEIFTDKDNNQIDFCVFSNNYIVDSWNYLSSFKK
jgi:putative hemolysin